MLYVEDDETLGFVTKDNLEMQGYEITHCTDGKMALEQFNEHDFDLCILDVMLPEIDGFEVAERIRKYNRDVPIIFLTAKSLKEDRLYGLKLGGDDYLTKPFSIEELLLKIEIFLKRRKVTAFNDVQEGLLSVGNYTFDHTNLELAHKGESAYLTQREADLLLFLVQNKNKVLKRSDILVKIWGEDDYFLGRSLDVFISRLRKYLKEDENVKLENVHGVGFRLKA